MDHLADGLRKGAGVHDGNRGGRAWRSCHKCHIEEATVANYLPLNLVSPRLTEDLRQVPPLQGQLRHHLFHRDARSQHEGPMTIAVGDLMELQSFAGPAP